MLRPLFTGRVIAKVAQRLQNKKPRPVVAGQGLEIIEYRLLPLDGFSSVVTSFQLHPVFGAVSSRVLPSNTVSCFVGLGDKSWDNFKIFFQTQGFEFFVLVLKRAADRFWRLDSAENARFETQTPFSLKAASCDRE